MTRQAATVHNDAVDAWQREGDELVELAAALEAPTCRRGMTKGRSGSRIQQNVSEASSQGRVDMPWAKTVQSKAAAVDPMIGSTSPSAKKALNRGCPMVSSELVRLVFRIEMESSDGHQQN